QSPNACALPLAIRSRRSSYPVRTCLSQELWTEITGVYTRPARLCRMYSASRLRDTRLWALAGDTHGRAAVWLRYRRRLCLQQSESRGLASRSQNSSEKWSSCIGSSRWNVWSTLALDGRAVEESITVRRHRRRS